MKGKVKLLSIFVFMVFSTVFIACDGDESSGGTTPTDTAGGDITLTDTNGGQGCRKENESCDDTNKCCDQYTCINGKCVSCLKEGESCLEDNECCQSPNAQWCNFEGVCAKCEKIGGSCTVDDDCCPAAKGEKPIICKSDKKCGPVCQSDKDCGTDGKICDLVSGECIAPACSSDEECAPQKCVAGKCGDFTGTPEKCVITSKVSTIHKGQKIQLHAIAYKGTTIIPWQKFTWTSSVPASVSVDENGVITGGESEGVSVISAKVGNIDCDNTLSVKNYLPTSNNNVRVIVLDQKTQKPIANATVVVGDKSPAVTDSSGKVEVTSEPADIHVFHADYTYVSVVGAKKSDYVVYLPPKPDLSKAGGFRGKFDFSQLKYHSIELGIAGCSVAGDLLNFDFNTIVGEMLAENIVLTEPTSVNECIELPSGLVVTAKKYGINDLIPKNYRVACEAGFRSAWGLGGGLSDSEITALINLLSPIISGGDDLNIGQLLAAILPLFNKFSHGSASAIKVDPIPTIDTPKYTEGPCKDKPVSDKPKIPDFDKFQQINMTLTMKLLLKSIFDMPMLPKIRNTYFGGLVGLGAIYIPELGVVPMGLTAATDSDDPKTPGDGKINKPTNNPDNLSDGQLALRMAPAYNGFETNNYVYAFLAIDFNNFGGGTENAITAIIKMVKKVEKSYDLSTINFLGFPEGGDGSYFDRANKKIKTQLVNGATFYRYAVEIDNGNEWFIYIAPDRVGTEFTLPALPSGYGAVKADSDLTIHSIKLLDGWKFEDIVMAGGKGSMADLMTPVEKFSTISCIKKLKPEDADYAKKCGGEVKAPACNPICELK
ncbi:MAG: hypothetical protein N2746_03425 [Deltaproteobacteria bacterium]|nr:hypothetical protein [Deltaproteobacteria bacterium]